VEFAPVFALVSILAVCGLLLWLKRKHERLSWTLYSALACAMGISFLTGVFASSIAENTQDPLIAFEFVCAAVVCLGVLFAAFGRLKSFKPEEHDSSNQIGMSPSITPLLERHEFLETVFNNASCMLSVTDPSGRILLFNAECERVSGYSAAEVLGKEFFDLLVPDAERDQVREMWGKLCSGDFPSSYENQWVTKAGMIRHSHWRNTCLLDDHGNIEFVVGSALDVTDLVREKERLQQSEVRLRKVIENLPVAAVYSSNGLFQPNSKAMELLGYESYELDTQEKWFDKLYSGDQSEDYNAFESSLLKGSNSTLQIRTASGETRWIEFSTYSDDEGLIWVLFDMTDLVQAANKVQLAKDNLEKALSLAHVGSWILNYSNNQSVWSNELFRLFGLEPKSTPPSIEEVLNFIHPDDRLPYLECMELAQKQRTPFELEHKIVRGDGSSVVVISRSVLMSGEDRMMGTVLDITHLRLIEQQAEEFQSLLQTQAQNLIAANHQLEQLATRDGLTGLWNHRHMQERLKELAEFHSRRPDQLSFILFDVDHFKSYNDSFGHPEGDKVLKDAAEIVQHQVRASDVAARYGGEEFAVILPCTDIETAAMVAERIRAAVQAHDFRNREVTVSVGVATWDKSESISDMINRADKALYLSKHEGRNRVTVDRQAGLAA
jgi:diguanylate cyclase (GGDEF)-like protein/PAS domain S-box-containing protein